MASPQAEALEAVPEDVAQPVAASSRRERARARWAKVRAAQAQLGDRERLFAAWIGATAVIFMARFQILTLATHMFRPEPELARWIPLAVYQDVLFVALLSWAFWMGLPRLRRPRMRRAACLGAWALSVFIAAYAATNAELYKYFQGALTYQLLALSNHLTYIRDTLVYFARNSQHVHAILLAPLYALVIAAALYWAVPGLVRSAARGFHSPAGAACVALYVVAGMMWGRHFREYWSAFQNPEWQFAYSLVYYDEAAFLVGKFPKQYLADFLPPRQDVVTGVVGANTSAPAAAAAPHPMNVVMVVGESLGSKYMHLFGARYADTPKLEELAQHAAVFDRVYVSCPYSDNAIPGLFTSVLPYHYWQAVLTHFPDLRIPGIGNVLQSHGYRVAYIHIGNLAFTEHYFLLTHGFREVFDKADLPGFAAGYRPLGWTREEKSQDGRLLPAAMDWLGTDRSKPFFMVLWTDDTHMPYVLPTQKSFGVRDASLNRYLNAVAETDGIVGQLEHELAARGLLNDTIVVVTGDHGEQFGQHGKAGHGFSLYEEEVRVPLIIANPVLFPHEEKIDSIERQIDIAPTLAAMLGFDPPVQWQGENLFAKGPQRRAYLFDDYHFGLVDGDYAYLYDARESHREIYDLVHDPGELHNLCSDKDISKSANEAYMRLAAWSAFQNKYLDKFAPHRH